jgi:hypothetical protein
VAFRGIFIIIAEAGERTCVPHLHIPGTTISSWLVVRVNIVLGTPPRNVCGSFWETIVLQSGVVTEGTTDQGRREVGRTHTAARVAWIICAISLALATIDLVLVALNSSHPNIRIPEPWLAHTVSAVAFSSVGAVVGSLRPENPMGWLFCAIGLLAAIVLLSSEYAVYALLAQPDPLPGGLAMVWIRAWVWVPYVGLFVLLFLVFPHGWPPTSALRWFASLVLFVIAYGTVLAAFSPGPIDAIGGAVDNPLGMEALRGVGTNSAVGPVETVLYVLGIVAAASLFGRMRRAEGVERQQIKWFTYATVVLVSGVVLDFTISEATGLQWLGEIGFVLTIVGLAGLPIAIGIAVLRYRLYNIDRIINRTLVYGSLTAMLVAVYFGAIVLFQRVFVFLTGEKSTLAVVASTLLIAALFNPLRRRIQSFIDRRFYRNKYDARMTLEAYSAKLRNDTDLDELSDDLVGVVRETMQPAHVSLWLRPNPVPKQEQPGLLTEV